MMRSARDPTLSTTCYLPPLVNRKSRGFPLRIILSPNPNHDKVTKVQIITSLLMLLSAEKGGGTPIPIAAVNTNCGSNHGLDAGTFRHGHGLDAGQFNGHGLGTGRVQILAPKTGRDVNTLRRDGRRQRGSERVWTCPFC